MKRERERERDVPKDISQLIYDIISGVFLIAVLSSRLHDLNSCLFLIFQPIVMLFLS